MEENQLTVLIPCIGRKSVINSINSVDYAKEIHVLLMNNDLGLDGMTQNKYKIPVVWHLYPGILYPGLSKKVLISKVTTKYFIILDDDDMFVEGYLYSAMDRLSTLPLAKWYCAHRYNSEKLRANLRFRDIEIIGQNLKPIESKIFRFSDYNGDINPDKIYPYSTSIFDTESYKKIANKGLGFDAFPEYGDDIIPGYTMVYLFIGILDKQHFLDSDFGDNSVSRRYCPAPLLNSLIYLIRSRCSFMHKEYQDIMIENVINKINYTNKHYEQAHK